MDHYSMLLGFMISWAKWLPTIIFLAAALILLNKLRVPRWQLWVCIGAAAVGFLLSPFASVAMVEFRKTYGGGGTLYIASFLSLLSANIAPIVLLIFAIKVRSLAVEAADKGLAK